MMIVWRNSHLQVADYTGRHTPSNCSTRYLVEPVDCREPWHKHADKNTSSALSSVQFTDDDSVQSSAPIRHQLDTNSNWIGWEIVWEPNLYEKFSILSRKYRLVSLRKFLFIVYKTYRATQHMFFLSRSSLFFDQPFAYATSLSTNMYAIKASNTELIFHSRSHGRRSAGNGNRLSTRYKHRNHVITIIY